MGICNKFWRYFTDTEPAKDACIEPTRPATPMPTIKEPLKDISEPVLSLVESIKNDEWELEMIRDTWPSDYYGTNYKATHVWLGKELFFKSYRSIFECTAAWMTADEKNLVAEEMFVAAQKHIEGILERNNQRTRESFMIFTKQDYNKEK
jgi:hypothetical protein